MVSQYTCIGLGYVYTLILEYVYICHSDIHVLYGGHGGVAVSMYRLGYVYTPKVEYVYICYSYIHVLYGGHGGVAVYMYRFRLCIYNYIRVRVYML